jgi:hypothetical protein
MKIFSMISPENVGNTLSSPDWHGGFLDNNLTAAAGLHGVGYHAGCQLHVLQQSQSDKERSERKDKTDTVREGRNSKFTNKETSDENICSIPKIYYL